MPPSLKGKALPTHFFGNFLEISRKEKMKKNLTLKLTESAVMIALATILSLIPIVTMPYGGGVTALSMLPIAIIAYRHGTGWGLLTALSYALIQMLFGLNNLAYATSWVAAVAIIFLDYIIAFAVLGLAGVFSKVIRDRAISVALGTFLACILRYICHVISGCTVWAGVSIPDTEGLIYSLGYNGAYMLPETILTVIGIYFVSTVFDLKSHPIRRAPYDEKVGVLGLLSICAAVCFDTVFMFAAIQNENGYNIQNLATLTWQNWQWVVYVNVAAVLVLALSIFLTSRKKK